MSTAVMLPGAPKHLPEFIHQHINTVSSKSAGTLADVLPALQSLAETDIEYVVGSIETPCIWWFAAHMKFAKARMLCQQEDGSWLNVAWSGLEAVAAESIVSAEPVPVIEPEPVTQQAIESDNQLTAEVKTVSKPKIKVAPIVGVDDTSKWAWNTFLAFAWKRADAERLYEDYLHKVQTADPYLVDKIESHAQQGKHAATLATALIKKFQEGLSEQEIKQWLAVQSKSQSRLIFNHLQKTFEKQLTYTTGKREQFKHNRAFEITLPQVELAHSLHPQSLRALKPAHMWDVYIDEAGSDFSLAAEELKETDTRLGRIVAFALPAGHSLAPLAQRTHGTDLTHAEIEDLLKTITSIECGVLGATLKKDLRSYSWISAVHQLTRWLLLMLPVEGAARVNVHIEKRAQYVDSTTLKALQDTLEDELKLLLPTRFSGLQLNLEFMDKDHPYNGYVDAIANCWGSNDPIKRKLLARTAWRGTCLLQTTDLERVENLYRSISSGADVSASDWFELCAASTQEPEHSLFHDMLEQLGEQANATPQLWQNYMQEVRQRLASKRFTSSSLRAALAWLNMYQGHEQLLPAIMNLQLSSLELAAGNHEGLTHLEHASKVLALVKQLEDEDAVEACQAVLRVVVRATHHYDFTNFVPLVQRWLDYPVAVPGMLNHAKLYSTLGQLYAFQGLQTQAVQAFDLAIEHFEKLSDRGSANKDIQQTLIYKAVAAMDAQHEDATEQVLALVAQSTTQPGQGGIARLARSGSLHRFTHYLLLRLLVSQPHLIEERHTYLAQEAEWKNDLGHPWMLINAYRAWLLQANQQTTLAAEYMQDAVDGCFESDGEMLNWMGHCLLALGQSLQLKLDAQAAGSPASCYPLASLSKLAQATTDTERRAVLDQVLPFNFH